MKKKVYLLGHPLAHSKSPVMHNAVFEHLGLDWRYLPMDCSDKDAARTFVEDREYLGMNITTPHKPLAFSCADEQEDSARLAGGANVLVNREGVLLAYNMDGEGCVANLQRKGFAFQGARILVCGTGPTALAIMHASSCAGAQSVYLVGRDAHKTEEVLLGYKKRLASCLCQDEVEGKCPYHSGGELLSLNYDIADFEDVLATVDLVINATPVGMRPHERLPFNTAALRKEQTVFDAVYGHGETDLIRAARNRGCKAYDGSGMLVAQAVATDKILFEAAGFKPSVTDDDIFDLMAETAGFEC